jgi:hypothetical protein
LLRSNNPGKYSRNYLGIDRRVPGYARQLTLPR